MPHASRLILGPLYSTLWGNISPRDNNLLRGITAHEIWGGRLESRSNGINGATEAGRLTWGDSRTPVEQRKDILFSQGCQYHGIKSKPRSEELNPRGLMARTDICRGRREVRAIAEWHLSWRRTASIRAIRERVGSQGAGNVCSVYPTIVSLSGRNSQSSSETGVT